mmetsp:Transcript_14573/g.24183  ORF Transcript_14573/g.24183 Transcript_14573/m.24183 type:complete len:246 (+) Transcript_14573:89-826(+)|eukprot:CAMPEP_0119006266 /NCGR_PEP_ID=MMETSP1176-20130426/2201_1 /TAXON_ID=265551 /ORGANISM="Synedropsis recta cf, Strain CCMP1620" /LENGTH=245 /DNA_ID=CAMNT_0006958165 /DNA_START=74 /DNA_END=811 /DNA_ORIENTATION=+
MHHLWIAVTYLVCAVPTGAFSTGQSLASSMQQDKPDRMFSTIEYSSQHLTIDIPAAGFNLRQRTLYDRLDEAIPLLAYSPVFLLVTLVTTINFLSVAPKFLKVAGASGPPTIVTVTSAGSPITAFVIMALASAPILRWCYYASHSVGESNHVSVQPNREFSSIRKFMGVRTNTQSGILLKRVQLRAATIWHWLNTPKRPRSSTLYRNLKQIQLSDNVHLGRWIPASEKKYLTEVINKWLDEYGDT